METTDKIINALNSQAHFLLLVDFQLQESIPALNTPSTSGLYDDVISFRGIIKNCILCNAFIISGYFADDYHYSISFLLQVYLDMFETVPGKEPVSN